MGVYDELLDPPPPGGAWGGLPWRGWRGAFGWHEYDNPFPQVAAGTRPPDSAHADDDQIALGPLERMFVTPEMRNRAREVFRGLTGEAFSDRELDDVLDQVIKNIELSDAQKFKSINPKQSPMTLSQEQCDILSKQIEGLSPEYREKARGAFENASREGRVICQGSQ